MLVNDSKEGGSKSSQRPQEMSEKESVKRR
jgi:hypothetical protein